MLKREFAKVGSTILFDYDSSALSDYAQRTLDRQAAFLKARPQTRVLMGGHADERGTREYNLALGERRASAARDYLVSKVSVPSASELSHTVKNVLRKLAQMKPHGV